MNTIAALRVARIVGKCIDRAGKKKKKKKSGNDGPNEQPEETMVEEEEPNMPWTILILMAVLVVLHLYHSYVERQVYVAIKPRKLFEKKEYYRLITHAFFHNSHSHLLFNLWAMWNCAWVERHHGSVWLALVTLESILFTSSLYVFSSSTLSYLPKFAWLWKRALRGFSGVLFHWMMLKLQRKEVWIVRGLFTVHRSYYPFATVLLIHLMNSVDKQTTKQAGTLMHCCGIAVGYFHVNGYLSWIMPSEEFASGLERWIIELMAKIRAVVEKQDIPEQTPLGESLDESPRTVLIEGRILVAEGNDNSDESSPQHSSLKQESPVRRRRPTVDDDDDNDFVLVDEPSRLPLDPMQGEEDATITVREARLRRFSPELLQRPKTKTE